ncbi:MAG: Asp23/Gls24 family envelope stress response protein [Oscillospiraceae bacterium]|nr:Asp23/Gls24 family envelope stress response protein [Oscillospiraceae bacterium]
MEKTKKAQLASLKISKDVIATISRVTALETSGVAAVTESHKNIGGLFSKGTLGPVDISLADDFAEIGICLDLEFGAKIPEVCAAVQSGIKENVQAMTGIVVSKVNVTVRGIAIRN